MTLASNYDPCSQNVYSGPHALRDYYDPDKNPPLPLVELPPELNPFHDDGVRIYAKMMTALPATNIKSLPGKIPTHQNIGTLPTHSLSSTRAQFQ